MAMQVAPLLSRGEGPPASMGAGIGGSEGGHAFTYAATGKGIAAAWEQGIKDSLSTGKAVPIGKGKQGNGAWRTPAASEAAILEYLHRKHGSFSGPQRVLAEELNIPLSTLNTAIRRLERSQQVM